MKGYDEMKVVYVDPERWALYVGELPDGKWGVWAQKGKDAPRKLRSPNYLKPEGYADPNEAQNALDLYVSNKRGTSPYGYCASWEVYVNGKSVTFEQMHAMHSGMLQLPIIAPPDAIVTLANIEYRIATHIQGAYENLLEVGNCLIEAKESGLIAHGDWEAWVRRNTNMSERQAQKLMQASRSVLRGSAMERLPISKIQAILALPEPEREGMAKKAADEGMTLRQLQEAVKARQEAEAQAARAAKELEALKGDIPKLAENMAGEMAESMIAERLQEVEDDRTAALKEKQQAKAEAEQERQRYMDEQAARLRAEAAAAEAAEESRKRRAIINSLHEQLENARKAAPAEGISEEAQAQIDALSEQLREAEAEVERQNELRQRAQDEMLLLQTDTVRGTISDAADAITASEITAAVRAFIGSVGVLPHMAGTLAMLPESDRQSIEQHIDMVAEWVEASHRAIQTIIGDGVISI